MTANALNGAFKDLFDLIVRLGSQVLVVLLEEVEIAVPQVDLAGIVAERAFVDFLGLCDGQRLIALWIALLALHEQRDVRHHVCGVDRVLVANLLQHLHVLLALTTAMTGLMIKVTRELSKHPRTYIFDLNSLLDELLHV